MTSTETSTEYKRGTRVVLANDIPGVPEGTHGKLGRALGFGLKRYRVSFDNQVEVMSVVHNILVPEKEWPSFLKSRTEQAAKQARIAAAQARIAAEQAEAVAASMAEADATAAGAKASDVTAAPAAAEAVAVSMAEDASDDPRLAKLLERSKSARESSGVASSPATPAAPATPSPAEPVTESPSTQSISESAANPPAELSTESPAEPSTQSPENSVDAPVNSAVSESTESDTPQIAEAGIISEDPPPADIEINEPTPFVPGPEIDIRHFPADNRVYDLLSRLRSK